MEDEIDQEATLQPLEPRPFFLYPLLSYKHRICFDLRDDTCLGLVRALYVGEDDSGCFVEVLSMEFGAHIRSRFYEQEIGYLDYHEAVFITADELLDNLNECKNNLDLSEFYFGFDDFFTDNFANRYEWLLADLVEILCINRLYTQHSYRWLLYLHYTEQIPMPEMAPA